MDKFNIRMDDGTEIDTFQDLGKELEELKKDHPDYPKFKLERLLKEHPPQDNSEMINNMEEIARRRIQSDIDSKKFESIMNKPEDPDLHKGINSVAGNEHIKKQFSNLPKFRNRSQRLRHARNTLGIGPYLTGEAD